MTYVPDRGDVVRVSFNPQAGWRPALVLSPKTYNAKVGLALLCPVTSQGVILSDQVKSLDWRARKAELWCRLPPAAYQEVLRKLQTILG